MSEPKANDIFESILSEMTGKAAQCAMEAWATHVQEGCIGDWRLPTENPVAMRLIEHGFKCGYGLALLDHVQKSVQRLKGLGDAAAADGVRELRKVLIQ